MWYMEDEIMRLMEQEQREYAEDYCSTRICTIWHLRQFSCEPRKTVLAATTYGKALIRWMGSHPARERPGATFLARHWVHQIYWGINAPKGFEIKWPGKANSSAWIVRVYKWGDILQISVFMQNFIFSGHFEPTFFIGAVLWGVELPKAWDHMFQ